MSAPEEIVAARLAGARSDLDEVLARVEAFLRRYIAFTFDAQPVAVTLWVAHTHVIEAAEVTPYLAITSPEKECGKSNLLAAIGSLARAPWRAITPSEAVVFRKIDRDCPALLLDEVDAIFKDKTANHEGLRAILNEGYRRSAKVPRCVGKEYKLVEFAVFSPKALAGIGNCLPDTVTSRSIPISLRRRAPGEHLEPFRARNVEASAAPIRDDLARLGTSPGVLETLREARPEGVSGLGDRAADLWEILLAIADAAGGDWPARARAAAVALRADRTDAESVGVLLLRHIWEAFGNAERMMTAELLAALCDREEGPWAAWWGDAVEAGRTKGPASRLARLVRPFEIKPRDIRTAQGILKGYLRADFQDAWERYVQPLEGAVATVPPFPPAERRDNATLQVDGQIQTRQADPVSRSETAPEQACRVVASSNGGEGEEALPIVPGSGLQGAEREALELVKRELGAAEPPGEGVACARHRINAGESNLFIIVRDTNARGFRQMDGRPWTAAALEAALGEEEATR